MSVRLFCEDARIRLLAPLPLLEVKQAHEQRIWMRSTSANACVGIEHVGDGRVRECCRSLRRGRKRRGLNVRYSFSVSTSGM